MKVGGVASKYDTDYCQRVVDLMGEGLSQTAAAGEIGVTRQTFDNWRAAYPAFDEALRLGQAKRTAILERQMLKLENGPGVTARIFALKNAAPDEWRDKSEVDHNVKGELADIIAARRAKVARLDNGDEA